jgi:nicotinamidase-related amidase
MPKKALVVIDVQNIFFADGKYQLYQAEEVTEKINCLIKNARQNDVPLIFVRHQDEKYMQFGSDIWQIYDGLDARKSDFYIEKKTPDSFFETSLQELLAANQIEEIYLCGMQTDYCIDTTCRSAFGKKIKAFLIEDAHSTFQTGELKAEQIIKHHNKIIGHWFATLIPANEVNFKSE